MFKALIKGIDSCFRAGAIIAAAAAVLTVGCQQSAGKAESVAGDMSGEFHAIVLQSQAADSLALNTRRGKQLFDQYCAICHGESGDGNGFNAYNIKSNFGVQPFDFTDSSAVSQTSFDEIEKAIAGGGPAVGKSPYMPPWGSTFNAYDLKAVSIYAWRALAKMKL